MIRKDLLDNGIIRLRSYSRLFGKSVYMVCLFYVDKLLIDTGQPRNSQEIRRIIKELVIEQVVNTHHHEDHAGNNPVIKQELGITPKIHPLGIDELGRLRGEMQAYRRLIWGNINGEEASPLETDEVYTDKHLFKIIHTPGHSPEHICLFEPKYGWLFTGDMFINERVKVMRPEESLEEFLSSLKKLIELDARVLYCSHGRIERHPASALRTKLSFYEELIERSKELYSKGLSPIQIRLRLLGKEGMFKIMTLGHYTKQHLIDKALEYED